MATNPTNEKEEIMATLNNKLVQYWSSIAAVSILLSELIIRYRVF